MSDPTVVAELAFICSIDITVKCQFCSLHTVHVTNVDGSLDCDIGL